MTNYEWERVIELPDGRRVFSQKGGPRWAIADDEPQDTDDGVMWLDFDWNLAITSPDVVFCIPIESEDGERFSINTDITTLLFLAAEFEWPLEDDNAKDGIAIYSVVK